MADRQTGKSAPEEGKGVEGKGVEGKGVEGIGFLSVHLTNPFLASTLLPLAHSDLAPTLFHTPTFLTTQAILQLLLRYLRNVCAPA
ncbi:hypothetical protein CGGC5_v009489 [Colletotrichum fructicola Nara gc5]|uniref:Uncharacterized protein n=1 Tax=Colletotrichum fructicola (strain Nara gc5) TaxID=1213859 RepID=A0A7J6IYA1_COLFN|nr:hypothetical protein CFRS1_v008259 [Colletotrichum fructicola]KAF4482274.1 hypothetical protein CGGC5_v009489 [Colletotrichum fructicola Nara gc5]